MSYLFTNGRPLFHITT